MNEDECKWGMNKYRTFNPHCTCPVFHDFQTFYMNHRLINYRVNLNNWDAWKFDDFICLHKIGSSSGGNLQTSADTIVRKLTITARLSFVISMCEVILYLWTLHLYKNDAENCFVTMQTNSGYYKFAEIYSKTKMSSFHYSTYDSWFYIKKKPSTTNYSIKVRSYC